MLMGRVHGGSIVLLWRFLTDGSKVIDLHLPSLAALPLQYAAPPRPAPDHAAKIQRLTSRGRKRRRHAPKEAGARTLLFFIMSRLVLGGGA
jgi:hypothetical protein